MRELRHFFEVRQRLCSYVVAADEGLNSASITKAYSYVVRQREGLNSGLIVSVAVLLFDGSSRLLNF